MSGTKITHFGHIDENGKLHLNNERRFRDEIKALSAKPVIITIERKSKKRSTRQNKYYWGIVVSILMHELKNQGWRIKERILDADDVHEMLKNSFLSADVVNEETGEMIPTKVSTTKLTTTEFMEYIVAIQQWAAEKLNCNIPDPHEFVE